MDDPANDPGDDELRRLLGSGSGSDPDPAARRASAAHDDAVLQAMAATSARIRARSRRRWQVPLALAATAVLGLGLTLRLVNTFETPREPDAGALRGSASLTAEPENGAILHEAPRRLAWTAAADGTSYTVRLRDAAGNVVWEGAPLTAAAADLPDSARTRLSGGGSFVWQVWAQRPEGDVPLGSFWFEVRP